MTGLHTCSRSSVMFASSWDMRAAISATLAEWAASTACTSSPDFVAALKRASKALQPGKAAVEEPRMPVQQCISHNLS